MCSITMKLRRNYAVIAKICGAITRNCDEKVVITRIYDENFGLTHRYAAFAASSARIFDRINICHQIILLNQFIHNNKWRITKF